MVSLGTKEVQKVQVSILKDKELTPSLMMQAIEMTLEASKSQARCLLKCNNFTSLTKTLK